MKVGLSSLAWEPAQDDLVQAALVRRGVEGIELAPMKYWPSAPDVPRHQLAEFRARWTDAGISIIALQAILFGKPELQLFGSDEQRTALEHFLVGMTSLAGTLGATVLVLGAPKNRLRHDLPETAAIASAAPLLRRIAVAAVDHGCVLCVEPNPARYGGDFVGTSEEAMRLVHAVDHPGFGLHLDAGALAINAESDEQILRAAPHARHFHVSEIDLRPIGDGTVDHRRLAELLRRARFQGWCSIEMRPIPPGALAETIDRALDVTLDSYG